MPVGLTISVVFALSVLGFFLGSRRALTAGDRSRRKLHSLPGYHGLYVFLCVLLPSVGFVLLAVALKEPVVEWLVWSSLPESVTESRNRSLELSRVIGMATRQANFADISEAERAAGELYLRLEVAGNWIIALGATVFALASTFFALPRISRQFRARNASERIILLVLMFCSMVAIFTTVGVVLTLISESLRFFSQVPVLDFLFGLNWSPQMAIRGDQIAAEGAFGIVPVFAGTILITLIAMTVAVPIGLLAAIYMVEFAHPRVRATAKPVIEVLAGIPTVVYGFFAAVTVAPAIRDLGESLGLDVASESALAAGSVMGIMIIPFVSSLSDDVIATVPQRLRQGALELGATHGETIFRVVLPAALPGLLSALVLAISRALGETMIVVMAAGLFANLSMNPLDSVTTVTVQIATVLTGDQPFDSPTTLSAFALGLTLFAVTLGLNLFGLRVMEHYRDKYD